MDIFQTLGSGSLSVTAMLDFSDKGNTSSTASERTTRQNMGMGLVQWLKLPARKDRIFVSHSAFRFQRNKTILPRLLENIQYCGEPLEPTVQ